MAKNTIPFKTGHTKSQPSQSVIIGVACVVLALVFLLGQVLWQVFTTPTPEVFSKINQNETNWVNETTSNQSNSDSMEASHSSQSIYVYVVGAVNAPGMYQLAEGDRVDVAVKAAGGFSEDAQPESVNLARVALDGEQIKVLTVQETTAGSDSAGASSGAGVASAAVGGLVNINTATVTELTSLSGIGEATAKKIIADRDTNGPFSKKEDLKRVSGIGDKKYEAIADAICV